MHSLHSSKTKQNHKKNKKIAKFARNYKTPDKEMFDSDLKNTNWNEILKIEKIERGDVDYSFEIFNKNLNEILDKHAPFKKLSIQEKKTLKKNLGSLLEYLIFFFLSGFSFTTIHESQDCRGRGRAFL